MLPDIEIKADPGVELTTNKFRKSSPHSVATVFSSLSPCDQRNCFPVISISKPYVIYCIIFWNLCQHFKPLPNKFGVVLAYLISTYLPQSAIADCIDQNLIGQKNAKPGLGSTLFIMARTFSNKSGSEIAIFVVLHSKDIII